MSTFGFLANGSYIPSATTTSNIYANAILDMNNYNINNLADSIET
jgi:hypothetical protein